MVTSGGTPWWRLRQRERFARAVEASAHDIQPYDPKLAGELAVVMMLRRNADATAPDIAARDRMRATVLAGLAAPVRPSPVPRAAPAKPAKAPRVTGTRGRMAIALGAAFCLVLALSGMTLLLSRNALPGDPLYAVRRTVESASLGLTSGDDAKGRKHLEFAAARIGDIETLAARYPDLANSPVGDYLTAFADFDSDTTAGATILTGYATNNGSTALSGLRAWAGQQADRITRVEPKLPAPAHARAGQSVVLLGRVTERADALLARNSCYTITSGSTDDLGVLPATGPCDQVPNTAAGRVAGGQQATTGGTLPAQVPVRPGATGSNITPTPAKAPLGPTPTNFPTVPVVPPPVMTTPPLVPPVTTPTLPLPLPSLNLPGLPGLRIGS
jgi:hypothetical protein